MKLGIFACFHCRHVKKNKHPAQVPDPKTVKWLGRYGKFEIVGAVCQERGGGCMGTTSCTHTNTQNLCREPSAHTVQHTHVRTQLFRHEGRMMCTVIYNVREWPALLTCNWLLHRGPHNTLSVYVIDQERVQSRSKADGNTHT